MKIKSLIPWIKLWILVSLLGLNACNQKLTPPVQLRFAFRGDLSEIETLVATVEDFEKIHPQIKVQLECPDYYAESILRQVKEGYSAPDVVFVEIHDFDIFQLNKLLLDLNPFLSRDRFSIASYHPPIIRYFTEDKHLYVLPRDTAPICCVFYNRTMFQKAGLAYPQDQWQWPRDFLPVAKKLTQRDEQGKIICYGFADDWPVWDTFILSNGGHYTDNNEHPTRITLDSPECLEALKFRQSLMHQYQVMPPPFPVYLRSGSAQDYFVSGKVAMFLSGFWKTTIFRETLKFDWDVVLFPGGPSGPRRFATGGSGYAILKATPHPQEAWELLKFLSGKIGQIHLAKNGFAQPADMEIARSPYFLDGQKPLNKKMLLKAIQTTEYIPAVWQWRDFCNSDLSPALDKIWANQPVEPIIKAVVKRGNQKYFKRP